MLNIPNHNVLSLSLICSVAATSFIFSLFIPQNKTLFQQKRTKRNEKKKRRIVDGVRWKRDRSRFFLNKHFTRKVMLTGTKTMLTRPLLHLPLFVYDDRLSVLFSFFSSFSYFIPFNIY